MKILFLTLVFFSFLCIIFSSCKNRYDENIDEALWKRAQHLCETTLILDSHIDWPSWLHYFPEDISQRTLKGDFDYIRAKEGGLNVAFSVVYIAPNYEYKEGRLMVDTLLNIISDVIKNNSGKFALAMNPDDIRNNFKNNKISLPLALENGSPIGTDIKYLKYLKERGIQYITLTHTKDNQICDSSTDTSKTWNGLSPFGFEVIEEMNRLGIIIDISHSSDSASFQAINHSKAPVIASHSSCRHFTPVYERNLSDTLISLITRKKCVVMINIGSQFLDSTCLKNWEYLLNWYDSTGIGELSDEGIAYTKKYGETFKLYANSDDLVNHIDYIVKLVGVDYVGIGSDYDGIGYSQPSDLPDVSAYPRIVYKLLKLGYSEADIKKLLSENYIRVWSDVIGISDTINSKL